MLSFCAMKTALLIVSAAMAGTVCAAMLDGLAAKVNDTVITVGDVMTEIQRSPRLRGHFAASGAEDAAKLYSETLDMLIDRKLILQAAAEKKMQMQIRFVFNNDTVDATDILKGSIGRILKDGEIDVN